MRRILTITCLSIACSVAGICQPFKPFEAREKRLVQSISLSAASDTLYCALPHRELLEKKGESIADKTPRLAIYRSRHSNGIWQSPELLPFSGSYKDYEPTLMPGKDILLYNSNRPLTGTAPSAKNNIWFSRCIEGSWQTPKSLQMINTETQEESYPSVSLDGLMFYVAERYEDGAASYRIMQTVFQGEETPPGEPLVFDNLTDIGDPCVAPDGSYLIFTHFDPDNWQQSCDLYIAFRGTDQQWGDPRPLKMLNSQGPDFAAYISPDQKTLYYRKNYSFVTANLEDILSSLQSGP